MKLDPKAVGSLAIDPERHDEIRRDGAVTRAWGSRIRNKPQAADGRTADGAKRRPNVPSAAVPEGTASSDSHCGDAQSMSAAYPAMVASGAGVPFAVNTLPKTRNRDVAGGQAHGSVGVHASRTPTPSAIIRTLTCQAIIVEERPLRRSATGQCTATAEV